MRFLLAALSPLAALCAQAPVAPPESMFDGRTLDGWAGDPAVWSVRDGCLCGTTVGRPLAANTFLVWQRAEPADFEMCCAVRVEGDNNSGVQYRSHPVDGVPFGLAGYQCDVHPAPTYFAQLYEERGGGIVALQGQFNARDAAGAIRQLGVLTIPTQRDLAKWHTLRIVAKGNLVWHELDGVCVTAFLDDSTKAFREGRIGLQVHAGPPMTVWFKDLTMRLLPREELAVVPPALLALRAADRAKVAATGPTPQWIWRGPAVNDGEVFFRRTFSLPAVPNDAQLSVTCDNHCRVYLNGAKVAQGDDWQAPVSAAVAKDLRAGDNVLAVQGSNDQGPAGLVLRLSWTAGDAHGAVVSDASFRTSDDDPDGWNAPGFDDAKWTPATVLAALGAPGTPWSGAVGPDDLSTGAPPDAPQVAQPAAGLTGPLAAGALQLLVVPKGFGSWVAMCADDSGHLYATDQARGLYRVTPGVGLGGLSTIERVPVELDGCQGLCWFRGALYALQNGRTSGLYRITDTNGDGLVDHRELLREIAGNGEHGPHAVVVAPDGAHLLVMCGNHTPVPKLSGSLVPTNWAEDRPIPKIEDPNGHAVGIKAPGGFVCRVDPDGANWEMYCCGFRNAYDLAVLPDGRIVTYDSDMEWDMGLPWYRPTRIYEVLPGVDYGWRSGTSTWPVDYPEAPPALVDVGPGSPTGMVVHGGWVLALDWTYGTVYGLENGGGKLHTLLTGVPLPLTDAVSVGDTLYLLTGGRGIPSRLLALGKQPLGEGGDTGVLILVRRELVSGVERALADPMSSSSWAMKGMCELEDRELGPVFRNVLEKQPVASWRARVLDMAERRDGPGQRDSLQPPAARLQALLALARQGAPADLDPLLAALAALPFAGLDHQLRVWWLRVHSVALQRLGPATDPQRAALAQRLLPLFPTTDDRENAELAELLAILDAPGFLDKAVPMLTPLRHAAPPPWADTAARNASYGGTIAKMLANMPPVAQIAICNALRAVPRGWTLEQRRTVFQFLAEARQCRGGASYDGYLKAFVEEFWRQCSPAEQVALADTVGKARAELPKFASTPPRGPGRAWTLAEADAALKGGLAGADLRSGRNLFHAVGCASCHYFAGEGGNHGPDLTSLGNKFAAHDVLEAVIEPSKAVSDQYSGVVVTRRDGTTVFGRATKLERGGVAGWEVMPAVADAQPVWVPAAEVVRVEPSPLSPMPQNLVDRLSAAELRDLVAFLLSRGAGLEGR